MNFEQFIKYYHPDLIGKKIIPSKIKGYWDAGICPGGDKCRHAFRGALGSCDGLRLTIHFAEFGRDKKGRFLRPYREWEKQIKEFEKCPG